jgi:dihydrofolate reductase
VLGSGELVRTLHAQHLVDEYLLLIHPVVLGGGRRLFADSGPVADLDLMDSVITTKGVVLARYRVRGGTGR